MEDWDVSNRGERAQQMEMIYSDGQTVRLPASGFTRLPVFIMLFIGKACTRLYTYIVLKER